MGIRGVVVPGADALTEPEQLTSGSAAHLRDHLKDVGSREGRRRQQRRHVAGALKQPVDAVEQQLCKPGYLRTSTSTVSESGLHSGSELAVPVPGSERLLSHLQAGDTVSAIVGTRRQPAGRGTCVPPSMTSSEPGVLSAAASESALTVCNQEWH